MFEKIDGASVLVRQSGGFKVADVWKRLGRLYVKFGQTYIRLDSAPYTSKSGLFWDSDSLTGLETRSNNPRV
jgi:hypothetical protein